MSRWSPKSPSFPNAVSIFHPSLPSILGAQQKLWNALQLKQPQFTNNLLGQPLAAWFVSNLRPHSSGLAVIRSQRFGHHLPLLRLPVDTEFSPLDWFFLSHLKQWSSAEWCWPERRKRAVMIIKIVIFQSMIVYFFSFLLFFLDFLKKILLECRCFTLLYSEMIQLYVYIHPLYFGFSSHLSYQRALSRVLCVIQWILICYLSFCF